MSSPLFTCIGGGTGLATALSAVRLIDPEPSAVVGVVDDGGSSGRLMADYGGLPPGDMRKCLTALLPEGSPWRDLIGHRFSGPGQLDGHALGNLILLALAERRGDLAAAADEILSLLGCRGRVIPVSLEPHVLVATTDGGIVRGQVAVNAAPGIRRISLDPSEPKAHPEAVAAIERADVVVMGPGSLFTSVIPPLLVPGIRDALAQTSARRVFVANLAPQAAETRHLDLAGHMQAFLEHGGGADVVVYDPHSRLDNPAGIDLPLHPAVMEKPGWTGIHDPALLARALSEAVSA